MGTLRKRVTELETDVEELTIQIRKMTLADLLLRQELDAERRLNKEFRTALYASYRRGFPDPDQLELLWQKVEAIP